MISAKKPKSRDGKKFMAFGPPGLNPEQYHRKEVEEDEEPPLIEENVTQNIEKMDNANHDVFDETEAEVNLRFSKLEILKRKANMNSVENNNNVRETNNNNEDDRNHKPKAVKPASSLQRKLMLLKEKMAKMNDSSSNADTDSVKRQGDDSDSESISDLVNKLDTSSDSIKKEIVTEPEKFVSNVKNNVNPFKNLDDSKSVFVEKLVAPTLMVHTKKGNRIQPVSNIRDVAFGTDIHIVLKNMSVNKPMRPQTVSWPTILRGHSLFLVSPYYSGKTMGYLPAVCRLVSDIKKSGDLSVASLSCVILCATAVSVSHVEDLCKMFLHEARVFACNVGMTDLAITTTILNGCDILVCTPPMLVRLMRENFGLDLRNLTTFVIDDCERISEVYQNELKFCLFNVREMLKTRVNKEVKVQYVVASRIWCNLMSSLAKKAPDSVVCIGAFQECVAYSEVDTSVEFLKKENKVQAVLNFLNDIDKCKKTVIACRSDEEVHLIAKALTNLKYVVFACDNTMTVHELYNIDLALAEYDEPILGPILVCCDSNLNHINVTDASYLIHYSLPELFSMFCRRFSVLIDNYSSIFGNQETDVKIKILLENSNVEQLPRILHFVKRCSNNVPSALDEISKTVTLERELKKAKEFVPICNLVLSLGNCADIWYCKQRHAFFQEYDEPSEWIPREGIIAFKILHYHSAVIYSARMLSCTTSNGVKKYPQTYSMLSIKLGMYYSRDSNRKLHGIAKPGDICAVSLKNNLFMRCQVIKILKYSQSKLPSLMLINLIDEEKYEMASDTCLYHLPDELKKVESHAVKVILGGLKPLDKDISYSRLALEQLRNITERNEDLYMRGQISFVIGNFIIVETLEACQELSSVNEVVVKNNFKNELLDGYAINNPDHITTLQKLGEKLDFLQKTGKNIQNVEVTKPIKLMPKGRWAHLESDSHVPVYYLYAKSPGLFFVQHVKFQDCLNLLLKDIKKYVAEKPQPVDGVKEGDIVLAEFPDDVAYERARIDSVIDDEKAKCFFVDLGDWRIVTIDKILPITEKLITQLPFQAIECRLVGIKPLGNEWSEFSTNWLVDQFYDSSTNLKYLFAKRFTKEKPEFTEGGKYGVSLIDTYANDVCINKLLIEANLAEENEEIDFLSDENLKTEKNDSSHDDSSSLTQVDEEELEEVVENKKVVRRGTYIFAPESKSPPLVEENDNEDTNGVPNLSKDNQLVSMSAMKGKQDSSNASSLSTDENSRTNQKTIMDLFRNHPIRSVPLVGDNDDFDDDKWDSHNAVSMLCGNQSPAKVIEVSSPDKESKVPPLLAIDDSNPNNKELKSECTPNKSTASLDKQQNVTPPSSTSTPKLNNSSVSTAEKNENSGTKEQTSPFWSLTEKENILSLYDEASTDDNILKLIWCQEKKSVTIQIQVITEKYDVNIKNKEIAFKADLDGSKYGFEFELYGVINTEKSTHYNKGTYVEITLNKVMPKMWLKLNKGPIKKLPISTAKNTNVTAVENKETEVSTKRQPKSQSPSISSLPNIPDQTNNNVVYTTKMDANDTLRKPKLVWRQNKYKVTIKVMLITEKYDLTIKERYMKFYSNANDEDYGFEFDLYGVVDVGKSAHSNKGQYIQISLTKIMAKNWIALCKGSIKKWIVYDVDNIEVSSEEEDDPKEAIATLKESIKFNADSENSDEDFQDDSNFGYKNKY